MSESTYFKVTTKTKHGKPISELEYLLYSNWDVWGVQELLSEDVNLHSDSEPWYRHNIFKVWIYELDEVESYNIIQKVLQMAKYLNIDIDIKVINRKLTKNEIINFVD